MRFGPFIISLGFVFSMSTSTALAQDMGTYRPGNPYHAAPSPSADQCASQCSGDAQCKSWNFVKIRPNQSSGLCELNTQLASPVPSPLSISGTNATATTSSSANIISYGARTLRVGASPQAQVQVQVQPQGQGQVKPPARPQTQPQNQTFNRSQTLSAPRAQLVRPPSSQPVQIAARQTYPTRSSAPRPTLPRSIPQVRPTQPVGRSATPPQRPVVAPQFSHSLDTQSAPPTTQQPARPSSNRPPATLAPRPNIMPQSPPQAPQQYSDAYQISELQAKALRKRLQQSATPAPTPNHAMAPTISARQPRPMQNVPVEASPVPTPHIQNPPTHLQPSPKAPAAHAPKFQRYGSPAHKVGAYQPAQSVEQAQQSLFGFLDDDVVKPRAITPSDMKHQDLPIPTVTAAPTRPVTTQSLEP